MSGLPRRVEFHEEVPFSAVTDLVKWLIDACVERRLPLPAITLADTMGWAAPEQVKRSVGTARIAEDIIGRPLAGRVMHSGSLASYRHGRGTA